MPQHGSGLAQTVSSCSRISSDSPSASSTRMRLPTCSWFSPRVSTGIGDSTLLDRCHVEFADVHEMPGDGCGGSHYRADEMRAAVFALAAFEIAVAGAGAAFVRWQDVGIHPDAHAATCVAPFETGGGKNFVEAFFFGLRLDAARADEYTVHGNIHNGRAGFQPHIFERALGGFLIVQVLEVVRIGNARRDARDHARIGAP